MSNLIGQILGRYHILEQLGEGGMATVYKAFDTRLEANVAVKVIRTDNLPQSGVERALKRFEREAKALAQLNHPNIVKVIDYGEYEDRPYLVMPYLEGGTLKGLMQARGALPWQDAVRLLLPISKALAYAHQRGMIHRDVKPSNVLITDSGEPMLSDFGVTKIIEEEATVDLTGTNATVGTPEYMAPEQAISKSIDHRVDIYALGIVFYEMITGRKPYVADTPLAVLFKQASEPLPRPKQFAPDLPDKVEQIILKALAKKPEDRYQTMGEFAIALETIIETTPVVVRIKAAQGVKRATHLQKAMLTAEKSTRSETRNVSSPTSGIPNSTWIASGVLVMIVCLLLGGGGVVWTGTLLAKRESTSTYAYTQASPTKQPTPVFTASLTKTLSSTETASSVMTQGGDARVSPIDNMKMVYIPAGEFLMGESDNEFDTQAQPQHKVYLDGYWMDKTEVTQKMYTKCVTEGKCISRSVEMEGDDHPAVNVYWTDARKYCEWAGRRLPTEAEWEKGARGIDGRIYPWGNEGATCEYAVIDDGSGPGCGQGYSTWPVGSKPKGASPYGLLDMAGNVWEWVADWYGGTYYADSPYENPIGPSSGYEHILRGGPMYLKSGNQSTFVRVRRGIDEGNFDIGFRCSTSQ